MKKKNVTIDDLAIMVQKGFDGVDISFDRIEGKLDKAEGRLIKIEIRMDNVESDTEEIRKLQIVHTMYRDEFEKLQNRVKALEKLLIKG